MRFVFCLASGVALLLVSGCARGKLHSAHISSAPGGRPVDASTAASDQKLIVTPQEGLEGKIAWVNSNLRFVVITFPVGQMPALDQRLNVYRRGLKVGEVRITGPQRDDSIVGDLVTGEAGTGDAIRDR